MGLKQRNGIPGEDEKVSKAKKRIKSTNRKNKTRTETKTDRQTWTSLRELHNSAADRADWQKRDRPYLPLGEREKQ